MKHISCCIALVSLLWVGGVQAETPEKWKPLFDGESTAGWAIPVFGGEGDVDVQDGNLVIGRGELITGVRYEKEFPKINYELRYEARRTQGYDFFAACTFPVKDAFCTFINGGWGGGLTGLSSIDGANASENETQTCHLLRRSAACLVKAESRIEPTHTTGLS